MENRLIIRLSSDGPATPAWMSASPPSAARTRQKSTSGSGRST